MRIGVTYVSGIICNLCVGKDISSTYDTHQTALSVIMRPIVTGWVVMGPGGPTIYRWLIRPSVEGAYHRDRINRSIHPLFV
jgi:hypothetical protein